MQAYVGKDPDVELYRTFRCGLVHQSFPKDHCGITWHESAKHLQNIDGCYQLYAQSLVVDLEKAITAYKADLGIDKVLQVKFEKRMREIGAWDSLQIGGGDVSYDPVGSATTKVGPTL